MAAAIAFRGGRTPNSWSFPNNVAVRVHFVSAQSNVVYWIFHIMAESGMFPVDSIVASP